MNKLKALVFYQYLPPWRIDVFNEMGKYYDMTIAFTDAFAGGYHAEILRFLVDTFACVLHFEFGIAFGAGTAFKGVAQYAVAVPLVTAVGAGNVPFLGAVADMFNTVAVCPIYLCR